MGEPRGALLGGPPLLGLRCELGPGQDASRVQPRVPPTLNAASASFSPATWRLTSAIPVFVHCHTQRNGVSMDSQHKRPKVDVETCWFESRAHPQPRHESPQTCFLDCRCSRSPKECLDGFVNEPERLSLPRFPCGIQAASALSLAAQPFGTGGTAARTRDLSDADDTSRDAIVPPLRARV